MIALDTNVMVRLITRDDPEQTRGADALLSAKATGCEALASFDEAFGRVDAKFVRRPE